MLDILCFVSLCVRYDISSLTRSTFMYTEASKNKKVYGNITKYEIYCIFRVWWLVNKLVFTINQNAVHFLCSVADDYTELSWMLNADGSVSQAGVLRAGDRAGDDDPGNRNTGWQVCLLIIRVAHVIKYHQVPSWPTPVHHSLTFGGTDRGDGTKKKWGAPRQRTGLPKLGSLAAEEPSEVPSCSSPLLQKLVKSRGRSEKSLVFHLVLAESRSSWPSSSTQLPV